MAGSRHCQRQAPRAQGHDDPDTIIRAECDACGRFRRALAVALSGEQDGPLPASGWSLALLPCTTMVARGAAGRLGLRRLLDGRRSKTSHCEAAPLPVLVARDADGIAQTEDLAGSYCP